MSQLAPSHRQRCQQPELANILLNETMIQQKIDAICIEVNSFQKQQNGLEYNELN